MKKLIGLSGAAGSGKDTFFHCAHTILQQNNVTSERLALGDIIKKEMREFIKYQFDIDVLNCTRSEKDFIRPIIISYGNCKRQLSCGECFYDKLEEELKDAKSDIVFVTDVRYAFYKNDEAQRLLQSGGVLIHIKKYYWDELGDKNYFNPTIKEEKENDPILRNLANVHFEWENQNIDYELVKECLFNNKIL